MKSTCAAKFFLLSTALVFLVLHSANAALKPGELEKRKQARRQRAEKRAMQQKKRPVFNGAGKKMKMRQMNNEMDDASNLRRLEEIPEPPTDTEMMTSMPATPDTEKMPMRLATKEEFVVVLKDVAEGIAQMEYMRALPNMDEAAEILLMKEIEIISTNVANLIILMGLAISSPDEATNMYGKTALMAMKSTLAAFVDFANKFDLLESTELVLDGAEIYTKNHKLNMGEIFSLRDINSLGVVDAINTKLASLIDEISSAEYLDELKTIMEDVDMLQDSVRNIGKDMKALVMALDAKIDVSELEHFALKFNMQHSVKTA